MAIKDKLGEKVYFMKNNKNNNKKVLKFSIRKLSFSAKHTCYYWCLNFGSFVPTDVHAAEAKNTNVKFLLRK